MALGNGGMTIHFSYIQHTHFYELHSKSSTTRKLSADKIAVVRADCLN